MPKPKRRHQSRPGFGTLSFSLSRRWDQDKEMPRFNIIGCHGADHCSDICAALGGEQFPLTSPTMMLALLDFKFPHS